MLELFLANRALVQQALVVALFALAFWRGSGPEKACSSVLLGMLVVHVTFRHLINIDSVFSTLDPVNFLIDTGGLVAFILIALKANRFYPLVLAAAQLVSFMAHLVRLVVEPISGLAYYLLAAMPFWFQIILLGAGLAHHVYRSSFVGDYRDWRAPLPVGSRARYS